MPFTSILALSGDTLPTIAITQDMLKPIAEGITSNVGVILPICIAVFAVMIGVKLIPKLVSKFVH